MICFKSPKARRGFLSVTLHFPDECRDETIAYEVLFAGIIRIITLLETSFLELLQYNKTVKCQK
jgi:hypothetical protein